MKEQCTPSDYSRIRRWEHEAVLERDQQRLDRKPIAMTLRRCTVAHVFGTLKYWMGSTNFLMKKLPHVNTEMSLHVLAYNLKRAIAILGKSQTMKAIRLMGRKPSSMAVATLSTTQARAKSPPATRPLDDLMAPTALLRPHERHICTPKPLPHGLGQDRSYVDNAQASR